MDRDSYCKVLTPSQVIMGEIREKSSKNGIFDSHFRGDPSSKNQLQSDLYLPWRIGVGSLQEICRSPIVGWEVIDSNLLIDLDEISDVGLKTVVGNLHPLIVTIEQVKGFSDEL